MIRFHHAYGLLTTERVGPATAVAIDAGFFDQSHLIRDFRQFAGESPETFLKNQFALGHVLANA